MTGLTATRIDCPYCGEAINVLLDPSDAGHEYTEDCQVCCRPMLITVSDLFTDMPSEDADSVPQVWVRREDDG